MAKGGTYQWWRILTFVMFGIMAGSLLFSGIVVYNYTFRTLEDAHTIVLLNTETIINTVNLDNYNKALSYLNTKETSVTVPAPLRNFFEYGFKQASTSTPTSSSTALR